MKTIWKVIALMAVIGMCLAISGVALGADKGGFYIDKSGLHMSTGELTHISQPDTGKITEIDIDVLSIDINIVTADKYGYEIFCRDSSAFKYSVENGRLKIEQHAAIKLMTFSLFSRSEAVNVFLPAAAELDAVNIKNMSGNLSVGAMGSKSFTANVTSGNIKAGGMTSGTIKMTSSSGNIEITDSKAESFVFEMTSGNLSASGLKSDGLKAKLMSGNMKLGGTFKGDTVLNTTSGNVTIDIDGAERDYNRNVRTVSGSVRIDGKKGGAGNVNNNAASNLDIKLTSGDAAINFIN